MSELTKSFQEARQIRRYGKLEEYKFKTVSKNQVVPEEDITIKDVCVFAGIIGAGVVGIGVFLLTLVWCVYLLAPL